MENNVFCHLKSTSDINTDSDSDSDIRNLTMK